MKLRVVTKEGKTVEYDEYQSKNLKIVCHNQTVYGRIVRKYKDFLQIYNRFIIETKDGKYLSIPEWSVEKIEVV